MDKKIGVAAMRYRVYEEREAAIVELAAPRSGSTHAIISETGQVIALLSKDQEGIFLVDSQITTGEVTGYYLDSTDA